MNALEAREIAEAYNNNIELEDFNKILKDISFYAKEGEFEYWVYKEITTLTINKLKELGFCVTKVNNAEYQITW